VVHCIPVIFLTIFKFFNALNLAPGIVFGAVTTDNQRYTHTVYLFGIRSVFDNIKIITMRTSILILLAFMFFPAVLGQTKESVDSKTQKELRKEEKKRVREAEKAQQAAIVDTMVNLRRFVLEADYLSNQYGSRVVVSSNLNFIIVDSTRGTIQTASISGVGGPNMMGGITADGNITQYELTKLPKKRGYSLRLMIMTSVGIYDIFFNISTDGSASATLGGNWGGKLNFHGNLVPLGLSRVYKGRSI